MKKIDWFFVFFFVFIYLTLLYSLKKEIFSYRFDNNLIKRYFCSQNIPYEPKCKRIWLSDEEIYIASGYLYAKGQDPTAINFQHMPFFSLVLGFITKYFGNPYLGVLFFGVLYIILIYFLGIKIFKKRLISFLAVLFILVDPLFIDISSQVSNELGQAFFNLLYFSSLILWKNWFLAGIFLGMFAGSKFYGATIFFGIIYHLYIWLKKEFNFKKFIWHLFLAFFIFNLFYLNTYLKQGLKFNIFFFQLKVIKFWLSHSITNIPFASVLLFVFGIFKKWWDNYQLTLSHVYSFLWPVSLLASLHLLKKTFVKKRKKIDNEIKVYNSILIATNLKLRFYLKCFYENLNLKTLIFLMTPLYLLYLGPQVPFVRYFVIILPFSYLTLAYFLNKYLIK